MKSKNNNLAFKCTWNDAGFKGICSRITYEYNISKGRAWCNKSNCQNFKGIPTDQNHPCYESIIFTEWRYGAGWDHKKVERPKKITRAAVGKMAIITTLKPNEPEIERKIIGFFKIKNITLHQKKETVVYGDPSESMAINQNIQIKFWHYYKNPKAPNRYVWGSGLFRYVDDKTIADIFKKMRKAYIGESLSQSDILKIDKAMQDYKDKQSLESITQEFIPKPGIKSTPKSCAYCGYENHSEANFCNKCGKRFGPNCLKCNTLNPLGSEYCFQCGIKFDRPLSGGPKQLAEKLIEFGRQELDKVTPWVFTANINANKFVSEDPNAFLFAVILDQGIDAEKAWESPYEFKKRLGHLDPQKIAIMADGELFKIFGMQPKLHRFWKTMALRVKKAFTLIEKKYEGNARNIWEDKPDSRTLFNRLVEFDGIGQKKASMVVNILSRKMGVEIRDQSGIDVSYDEMVRRTFLRFGFVEHDSLKNVLEAARKLNPEYPGALDYPAWHIGRSWCSPKNPRCKECYVNDVCPKVGA